jgi:hypothetical protein
MNFKRLIITCCMFIAIPVFGQTALENILSPARLPYLKQSKLIQISSHDTTGGNNDFIAIPKGATATLASIQGPGVVVNFWVTIASADPYFLRRILLRMYWDGERSPSVEVPIGDFFGTGFQYKHYVTPYIGMSSGGYYCYFPMPFNRSARIEVVNQTGEEIASLYYHIDYQQLLQPFESDIAYFHACWHRDPRTTSRQNYTILEGEGEGHVVGMNLNMQSYDNDTQFLEGDEMVYVDGEKDPSIYGTGTEDYFNSGWYFNRGEFAAPYHGLILKDDSLHRVVAYRFHIQDAIPFKKSIRFTIEHGASNAEAADYSSTAYWYQKEPHKPFAAMLPAGLRIPLRVVVPNGGLEAESLRPMESSVPASVEDMSESGADWSSLKQLYVATQREGEAFTLELPVEEPGYDADLYFTRGPGYGNIDILQDGRKVGEIAGYSATIVPGGKLPLRNLHSSQGHLQLQFRVTGKERASTGYAVGLDAFVLEPIRKFIPEWYMIGPFPNPRDAKLQRLGLDTPYPPEKEFDPTKTYPGVDGEPVQWTLDRTPPNGRMDLYKYNPYEMVVVYALTFVYSPKDQDLPLMLGSDDGVKVFLNDKEIHRVLTVRVVKVDQDRVPLQLVKGWNKLMLKIENNYGGYNFYARVLDPKGSLVFSPKKER